MFALISLSLGLHDAAYADSSKTCSKWLGNVSADPKPGPSSASPDIRELEAIGTPSYDPWKIASMSEAAKLEAIQCLMGAEDDLRAAGFSGATRFEVSQTFAPAQVNLAALYLASYIYTGRYDHANAIALRGDDASYSDSRGNYVTKHSAIHRAYRAYRVWFAKVKQIGLAGARQAGLQPLDGTGLSWY